jgi:ribosomal silencing factor RsfS
MFQLVTRHLYFGVDAVQLRNAAERVLARLHGQPPERRIVGLDTLARDFQLSVRESLPVVDQMVQAGLLARLQADSDDYAITDKFQQYAQARIVEPLARSRAQLLLTHIADLAVHFNHTAARNKYEIEELAVYGGYMSREPEMSELAIAVTGRRRAQDARPLVGRATTPTAGREQIRKLFEELSSFVHVGFFHRLHEVPRPFSVFFRDQDSAS